MAVRSVSNAVCAHSHFWNPLCPQQSLLTRVTNIFLLALAVVVAVGIYRALNQSESPASPRPGQPQPSPKPKPPEKAGPVYAPADPPAGAPIALSALKIASIEEIGNIPTIVGVPPHVLHQRAMPLEKGGETMRGFIDQAALLNTIWTQWEEASEARLSHTEIADHLHRIVEAARADPKKVILYDPRTGSSDSGTENIPRFQVMIRVKRDDPDTDIFRPEGVAKDEGASYEEVVIINTAVQNQYIRWTPIRERYIREFGFYSKGMEFETVRAVLFGRFAK